MGIGKKLKKLVKKVAPFIPIVTSFIPGIGPLASAAISAGAAKLGGGDWGDALKAGALSGLGSVAGSAIKGGLASAFPETMSSLGMGADVGIGLGGLGQASGSSGLSIDGGNVAGGAWTPPWQQGQPLPWLNDPASTAASAAGMPSSGSLFGSVTDFVKDNPLLVGAGALGLMSATSGNAQEDADKRAQTQIDQANAANAANLNQWRQVLLQPGMNRQLLDMSGEDFSTYGMRPQRKFFDNINPQSYAKGGSVSSDIDRLRAMRGVAPSANKPARKISGKSKGQDDKISAKLSAGEFVIPADVVAHLGDGNNEAGATVLQDMMAAIRTKKTGNSKHPPKMQEAV